MNKIDGGPAFPCEYLNILDQEKVSAGMTLRDYFAGQALAGLLADSGDDDIGSNTYSKMAYKLADAMIAERAKDD